MKLPSLIGHTSELLRIIKKKGNVADKLASDYLRSKKYLGSNDRKFISELTFSILRNLNSIKQLQKTIILSNKLPDEFRNNEDNINYLLSYLGYRFLSYSTNNNLDSNNLDSFDLFQADKLQLSQRLGINVVTFDNLIDRIMTELHNYSNKKSTYLSCETIEESSIEEFSILFNMPIWIIQRLKDSEHYKHSELIALCNSLNFPAKVHLRLNSLAFDINQIIEKLKEFDNNCVKTAYSPLGIVLSKRINLSRIPLFKNGSLEIQDEGSQLISYALDPHPGESILDACAGAGGKTMHIATLMSNTGKIAALDVESKKLKELNRRAKNAGFSNIHSDIAEHFLKTQIDKFDKVLIDAPCSGLGTVRRNPMLKWTLTPDLLVKYSNKQKKILADYSHYVRSGGILIYSTCSFMPEENHQIVESFLANNPDFEPVPLKESFDRYDINLPDLSGSESNIQLLPSIHNTDGFYIAKLRKK